MKNKLPLFLSIALIVVGAVISYFAKFDVAQMCGFALTMFGAGALASQLWKDKKAEVPSWTVLLSLIFIGLGSFLAGLLRLMSEDQVKSLITLVVSIVLLIAGIVTNYIANKVTKKLN